MKTHNKKKVLTLLTYLLVGSCYCQIYKVSGKIFYTVSHAFDSTSEKRFNEVAVLYYGKDASLYKSYDREIGEKSAKTVGIKEENGVIKLPTPAKGSKDLYYSYPAKKEIDRVRDFWGELYKMSEPISTISWKISKETKVLGGYTCQKATGNCKGRDFIVWFCSDVPYRFGPWKLNGLPGLIFEAIDEKGKLAFYFNRLETVKDETTVIDMPTKTTNISDVEFEKIRKAYYDRPKDTNSGLIVTGGNSANPPRSMLINNPMDKVTKALAMPYNY